MTGGKGSQVFSFLFFFCVFNLFTFRRPPHVHITSLLSLHGHFEWRLRDYAGFARVYAVFIVILMNFLAK